MSGDALQPGEIDLDDAVPATVAATTDTTDTVAAAESSEVESGQQADTATAETAATDAAVPPKRQPSGAVGELIALRKENRQLKERQQQIESNPVIQRLTPEIQQAILEGRVQIAPPQSTREAEKERLTSVAEELGLHMQDGKPDIDAARRVDTVIRRTAQEAVAPLQQQTLSEKAATNYARAIGFAEANGFDVETVREVFDEVLTQPNGAELVAQRKVAERMWETAVGRMVTRGKSAGNGKKPAPTTEKPPAAIVTETTGRRASAGATVQLSPALAKVYKDSGLDPSKSFTATTQINLNGPIDLE